MVRATRSASSSPPPWPPAVSQVHRGVPNIPYGRRGGQRAVVQGEVIGEPVRGRTTTNLDPVDERAKALSRLYDEVKSQVKILVGSIKPTPRDCSEWVLPRTSTTMP